MAHRKKLSRKQAAESRHARWNALNDLCGLSKIDDLTPIQRVAHLAWWYMGEVFNGGHYQYFVNKGHYNHQEVIRALEEIGCSEHATNLAAALKEIIAHPIDQTESVDEFLTGAVARDLSGYDDVFNKMPYTIDTGLREYLDKHEGEFIEWVP